MKGRFTWRRQPRERGLAGMCQGERGYDLSYNGEVIAGVRVLYNGFGLKKHGYYYYGRFCDHRINTSVRPVPTVEEAKIQCLAWAKSALEDKQ